MLSGLAVGLAAYGVAALCGLLATKRGIALVYALCCGGAAALSAAAVFVLLRDAAPVGTVLPIGLPWLGAHLRVDALAALFLLAVNLVAALVSVFALGYAVHDAEPRRVLPVYPCFLAAMNMVIVADDAYVFLVSWEVMSLSSWLLVLANHRQPGTRHAAFVYLVMASIGTAALLLAFGLLGGSAGEYDFSAIRAASHPSWIVAVVLLLVLIGAGSKAGLVPLHAWLPLAHPAAPSHVSALMSGVMTKVALYGMIRLLFDLVGEPVWWWGAVLLLVGGITAPLGVLYAIMQRDLKTLLAYSTVENVGIVVIGLGLALAFEANGLKPLAALALAAALVHICNHALFKSLLFLGAGAVLVATGERDLERLGGLIHRLPVTAVAMLVGAAAIAALPPLNGFVSEWLTFQAVLGGAQLPQWLLKLAVPVVGAMLALSAALAGVCFVKAYGIVFLGRPRSDAAALAVEQPGVMTGPMLGLAALCALIGMVPSGLIALVGPVIRQLVPGGGAAFARSSRFWLVPLGDQQSSYSGLIIFAAGAALMALLAYVVHRYGSARLRRGPAWDCGFPNARPATQYTGSSMAQPIRRVFGATIFRARDVVDMPQPGELRPARFHVAMRDLAWEWVYAPVERIVAWASERANALQFLTIRRYLTLMFGALVVLLAIVAVSQ